MNKKIRLEIKDEAKRIFDIFFDIYVKNIEINKSFNEMVNEYINPKYKEYEASVANEIVRLIPNDLEISSNNKQIFTKS